jgi:ribosomal protein S18 acetylase RimI-like enzyme
MKIQQASALDIDDIVNLHIEAFPGFFLTSLGCNFLEELYCGFLSHPSGIFLIARKSSGLAGFVAGTSQPDIFFRNLRRRRGVVFLVKAIPAVLINPVPVVRKLIYAVRYRGGAPALAPRGALLSSIAVSESAMGAGVSGELIRAFEIEAIQRGSPSVYLTTDAKGNERVNAFYLKHGYRVMDYFKQSGTREMFRYEKNLPIDNG